jgi:hypothetical protein
MGVVLSARIAGGRAGVVRRPGSSTMRKTTSESKFESFLAKSGLAFEKIAETASPRPDYLVHAGNLELIFEVKELAEDQNFGIVPDPAHPHVRLNQSILGDHVRKKITSSRRQVRFGTDQGIPSILLLYNNLDPFHRFGTLDEDFEVAMYGEYTLSLDNRTGTVTDGYQGRNQSFREDRNTEFSAVGKLYPSYGGLSVTLFENAYAQVKLPYERLPSCFDLRRVGVAQ